MSDSLFSPRALAYSGCPINVGWLRGITWENLLTLLVKLALSFNLWSSPLGYWGPCPEYLLTLATTNLACRFLLFLWSGPGGRTELARYPYPKSGEHCPDQGRKCQPPLLRMVVWGGERVNLKGKGLRKWSVSRSLVAKLNSVIFCLWAASLCLGPVDVFSQTSEASTHSYLSSRRLMYRKKVFGPACVVHAQSCVTLCNPVNCSPPGSCVHGILQARILKEVAIFFSRGPSWPGDQTHISCIGKQILLPLHHLRSLSQA